MIGEEFAGLLAAAQGGSEAAFARLWRDANPALLRYLRVIAVGAEEEADGLRHLMGGLRVVTGTATAP